MFADKPSAIVAFLLAVGLTARWSAAQRPDEKEPSHKVAVIRQDPANAARHLSRGRVFRQAREAEAAIAEFQKAVDLDPSLVDAYQQLGDLYRGLDKSEIAAAYLDVADQTRRINRNPQDDAAYANRAAALTIVGRYDRALQDCTEVLRRNGNSSAAYGSRGTIHARMRNWRDAVADYDAALKIDARNSAALHGRALVHLSTGDLDKALSDLDAAIRLDPRNPDLRNSRGAVHVRRQDVDKGVADYKKAIELNARHPLAHLNRGHVHLQRGRLREALDDFDQAINANPGSADAYGGRAAVRVAKGELDAAEADFAKQWKLRNTEAKGDRAAAVRLGQEPLPTFQPATLGPFELVGARHAQW